MSLNKEDVWADLQYALDELEKLPLVARRHLTDASISYMQPDKEFYDKFFLNDAPALAYFRARARANVRIAHEAIEKGLKAILLDSGLPEKNVFSRRHELHKLLADVQKHNPQAFSELERCFDSSTQYLNSVTGIRRNTNIVDYFRKHGKGRTFLANRYASIEGKDSLNAEMIGRFYLEIILALSLLVFDLTPQDILSRIEDEARKYVLANSHLDQEWDAEEWLNQGSVRSRLEIIKNLESNKVLYAAIRMCAREAKDSGVQLWADNLRRELVVMRKRKRTKHETA
ncbi:MAG: hypothetical protein OXL39_15015 [Caldilineaceae bacterium]|nr:hypothetical protein [Caldilineaceae bacterium]